MERILRLSNNHGIDNYFCLRYGDGGQTKLPPCEPIADKELCLGIIDNNHLKPHRLKVLDKDRKAVKVTIPETGELRELNWQGKSALIVLDPDCCNKVFVREIVQTMLSGIPDRFDHLHVARVKDIENANWIPYWAPLQLERKILHVRLVAKTTLQSGSDPTDFDVEQLAQAFQKIC